MKRKMMILVLIVFGLVACDQWPGTSRTAPNTTNEQSTDQIAQNTTYQQVAENTNPNQSTNANAQDASIIKTASIYYDTIEYDQAKENIMATIQDSAIIEYQTERNYSTSSQELKELNLTLRVPATEYEDYITSFENIEGANLKQLDQASENVTKQIQDTELRLQSIENRIDRLNELNEQAENVAEIIEIETALNDAILQRDQILSDLEYLNDQVDMSTISIRLKEVLELEDGSGSQISWSDRFGEYLGELGYYILEALNASIIGIFFVIPFVILFFIIRWIIRRSKKG